MGELTLLMIGMGPTLKGMFVHRSISKYPGWRLSHEQMSNEEKPTSCLGIILHSYMGSISNNHEIRIPIKQPVQWKASIAMFLTKCLGSEPDMFSTMVTPGCFLSRWWNFKYVWNFHPETWGRFPFDSYFLDGVETNHPEILLSTHGIF